MHNSEIERRGQTIFVIFLIYVICHTLQLLAKLINRFLYLFNLEIRQLVCAQRFGGIKFSIRNDTTLMRQNTIEYLSYIRSN